MEAPLITRKSRDADPNPHQFKLQHRRLLVEEAVVEALWFKGSL